MKRRDFITLLGGAAAWPVAALGQQGERLRRIGVLMAATPDDPEYQSRIRAFQQGLAALGWVDGRNVRIDARWAGTNADDIRKHAVELTAFAPDAIVGGFGHYDRGAVAAEVRTFHRRDGGARLCGR
jgi:putative tryptophan/tyrosine transport system substrate-binding protein